MPEAYRCVVCGRPFPGGQGIEVRKSGLALRFHSSRCASRFFRLLMERVEGECVARALREVLGEYESRIKASEEASKKVI